MLLRIRNILSKNRFLIIIFILIAFVRLYRLDEFITFLGDQGRDAIIIKRIVTLEKLPAIGPVSSIGQVFLGPFYYYLMAPFLFLFRFNPLGLGFGVAFISTIFFILSFLIIKKSIDKNTALLFTITASFSKILVEFNRFSWNPNLLPFFSFFTLNFLILFLKTKKNIYLFLFGAFLSFSAQLHYLAFFLFLTGLFFIIFSFSKIKPFLSLKNFLITSSSFLLFYSPLIIFDLRHRFLNFNNLLKIFSQEKIINSGSFWQRFLETTESFFIYVFQTKSIPQLGLIIFVFFVYVFVKNRFFRNNLLINIHYLNFFAYLLGFSLLQSYRYPHYYMTAYLSFFLILSHQLSSLSKKNFFKPLIYIFIVIYLYFNLTNYPFLKKTGNFQIRIAKKIADSILSKNPKTPYQIVPIPLAETDNAYRYFLEIGGKRPLDEYDLNPGKELYVLCFTKLCNIENSPDLRIKNFKNKKIDSTWQVDRVKIYKIVHGK